MRLRDSAVLREYMEDLGPKKVENGMMPQYDFYRCYKCDRIFTREEEKQRCARATQAQDQSAAFCACGSLKYAPTKPVTTWHLLFWRSDSEWLHMNVLSYTLKLVLARGLAPWCDRHFQAALPVIEKLVQPRRI